MWSSKTEERTGFIYTALIQNLALIYSIFIYRFFYEREVIFSSIVVVSEIGSTVVASIVRGHNFICGVKHFQSKKKPSQERAPYSRISLDENVSVLKFQCALEGTDMLFGILSILNKQIACRNVREKINSVSFETESQVASKFYRKLLHTSGDVLNELFLRCPVLRVRQFIENLCEADEVHRRY